MKNPLLLCATLILTVLFSDCGQSLDEQAIRQFRISNEIIHSHLEEKRRGFFFFISDFPDATAEIKRAKHLIHLYDNDPNKFHDSTKYDSSINWLRSVVHKDSLWIPDPKYSLPDSADLKNMPILQKRNLVLTHYAKLFKDAGQIGFTTFTCGFGLFTGFQIDSTSIIGLKTNMPLMGDNYTLSINEPDAEVWPIKMLGLIHVPKNGRKEYEVVIRTEDPMYRNPVSDTVIVEMNRLK